MKVTIIGTKVAKTKSGKMGYTYYFQKPFTAYESENSECLGFAVGHEFSYIDFDLRPGDVVNFIYEPGYEERATLVDVSLLKNYIPPADKADKDKPASK